MSETGPITPIRLIQILQGLGLSTLTATQVAAILQTVLTQGANIGPTNPLLIGIAPPTIILTGQVAIVAPRTPLAAAPTPCKSVTIENPNGNNVVYVGNVTVAAGNGYRLLPGPAVNTQGTVSMDIDDLNKVYIAGTVGNIVSYIAVN